MKSMAGIFIGVVLISMMVPNATGKDRSPETDLKGFIRKKFPLDEGHLSYLYRPGKGPVLVLIPGSYSGALEWDDVVPRLDKNLIVVIVEMRGHGGSWPPPRNGSIKQFAADTIQVLDTLGIDRFYVGGHSIGGMISLEIGRECESRVKGILCSEGWTNYHAEKDAFGGAPRAVLSPAQKAKAAKARKTVTQRWSQSEIKAFGRIWRQWDGTDFLKTTEIPILEIYGDRGRGKPSLKALHIPKRSNITIHWIHGAFHDYLPLVRPNEIARAFTEFIRRVEQGEDKK